MALESIFLQKYNNSIHPMAYYSKNMFLLKETIPLMIKSSLQSSRLVKSGGAKCMDTKPQFSVIINRWFTYIYSPTYQKDRLDSWEN